MASPSSHRIKSGAPHESTVKRTLSIWLRSGFPSSLRVHSASPASGLSYRDQSQRDSLRTTYRKGLRGLPSAPGERVTLPVAVTISITGPASCQPVGSGLIALSQNESCFADAALSGFCLSTL